MPSQAPASRPGSFSHLSALEVATTTELAALAALTDAGWRWHGVAVAAAFEGSFYRLNNLPILLAALYRDLDPTDPDEDILEEVEAEALALVGEHYLLDEAIDAFYDAIAGLPAELVVRRAGDAAGRIAPDRRAALLALKHLYQDDWRVTAVLDRLALTGSLAIDARPVLLTPAHDRADPDLSRDASAVLGYPVSAWAGAVGELTRLLPA